jgi:hypothetical protein
MCAKLVQIPCSESDTVALRTTVSTRQCFSSGFLDAVPADDAGFDRSFPTDARMTRAS